MKILDIGCGYFKTKHSTGIDISSNSNADYIEDAEASQRFNGQFDLVIMKHVIEHSNSIRMMQAAHRFLKQHGRIYVETPNAYDLAKLIRFFEQGWYTASEDHVQTYGVFELTRLLENNGFKVLRHGYCKADSHYGVSDTKKAKLRSIVVLFKPQFNDGLWIEGMKKE